MNKGSLSNRDRSDQWAVEFIARLEGCLATDGDIIELNSGGRWKRRYSIGKSNLKKIIEYAKHKMTNDSVKPYSMARFVNYLMFFACFLGRKPFEEVRREDIEAYLNQRKDKGDSDRYIFMHKITIRSFFKWLYNFEQGYPEVVSWMKCKLPRNSERVKLLEMTEIQKMLEACDNIRDKTLISVLYESGARISEIMDLKLEDVKFDEYGAVLYVNGKTGSRPIRVVKSTNDLKQWINSHPFKNNNSNALFCCRSGRNYGGFIGTTAAWEMIKKIAKRAGIEKQIHPHMFRHTRATDLSRVLSDREMKIFFGWSANSSMPGVYSHLNAKDVDDKILFINGEKPKDELKPMNLPTFTCYRCQEVNNVSNKFCQKCYSPLDVKSIEQVEQLKTYINEFITAKLLQKPGFMEELPKLVEEWSKSGKQLIKTE